MIFLKKGLHLLLSVITVQYNLLYCRDITTYAYNVQKCSYFCIRLKMCNFLSLRWIGQCNPKWVAHQRTASFSSSSSVSSFHQATVLNRYQPRGTVDIQGWWDVIEDIGKSKQNTPLRGERVLWPSRVNAESIPSWLNWPQSSYCCMTVPRCSNTWWRKRPHLMLGKHLWGGKDLMSR